MTQELDYFNLGLHLQQHDFVSRLFTDNNPMSRDNLIVQGLSVCVWWWGGGFSNMSNV